MLDARCGRDGGRGFSEAYIHMLRRGRLGLVSVCNAKSCA